MNWLLHRVLALWVRYRVLPEDIPARMQQRAAAVCYVLERRSVTDLAVLQRACVRLKLPRPRKRARARSLVDTFLEVLTEQGAFVGAGAGDRYFVICDERVNRPDTVADGRVNLLLGFATSRAGEFDAWLVTHHPAASRVRPVTVNRAATSRQHVEWEIETTILKKMDYR